MITLACACGGIGEYAIASIVVAILGALGIKFNISKKEEETNENHT